MDCEPVLRLRPRARAAGTTPATATTRAVATAEGIDLTLTLTTDLRLGFEGGQASARTLLKEGDVRFVALSWGGAVPPADLRRRVPAAGLDRAPLAALAGPRPVPRPPVAQLPAAQRPDAEGPHLRADRRDRGGGHDVAAGDPGRRPQLRLPLHLDPGRDVRPVGACTRSASTGRRVDFFSFIADVAEQRRPPADHVRHRRASGSSTEYELDHLPGYANSRPVRIGNAAYAQQQHDVWGALLDSVYLHAKAADHLDSRIWPILDKQVGEALKHWREPDAGIWEVRGELKHFTSSKIMCWVAVDRGAQAGPPSVGEDGKAAEWELAAEEIKEDILANGVDERGVLTQYYGSTALDASLLLAPLRPVPARRTTRGSAPRCWRSPTS